MTSYDVAVSWWGQEGAFEISFETLNRSIAVPFDFVARCGDSSHTFLETVAQCCVNEPGKLVRMPDGSDQADLELSRGQQLVFTPARELGHSHFSWSRGPESKSPLIKPAPTRSESTYSDSKNTSSSRSGQMKFRTSLLARDGRCLLTSAERSRCTSAHVVPVSRFDVYRRILGIQHESQLYATSMGFLIRDDLHRAYDRFEWSWYYKGGLYYAHFFAPEGQDFLQLHGKSIDPRVIMRVQPREYVDPQLTSWHYQQTVLMRIRGFAEGFDPERT